MNQKNDNFIDKTFTVLADVLIKVLPATKDEKKAFSYYRYGMSCLLYTSPSPRDLSTSRMPSSA